MKRLFTTIFWIFFLVLLLLAIDQYFLRVPASQPALSTVRTFYLDFRSRLPAALPDDIEAVIEGAQRKPIRPLPPSSPQKKAAPASAADEPKFLYVDAEGGLHFAATLAEIPAAFRKQAQRLEE